MVVMGWYNLFLLWIIRAYQKEEESSNSHVLDRPTHYIIMRMNIRLTLERTMESINQTIIDKKDQNTVLFDQTSKGSNIITRKSEDESIN